MTETLVSYVSKLIESDAKDQMAHIAKYVPDPNPVIRLY